MTAARRAGRFGAVVTAMVTPFDGDGRVDSTGPQRSPAILPTTAATPSSSPARPAKGPTLTDAERDRALVGRGRRRHGAGDRRLRHERHGPLGGAHPGGDGSRRSRDPRRHALLQPPVPERDRSATSPPSRRPRALPVIALRHPDPHGAQGRPRDDAAARDAMFPTSSA